MQKCHWKKAIAHAKYLKKYPVGYMPWRPEGMMMWLESWRLQRLRPALSELGVDVKEDLLDLEEHHFGNLGMRLLEEKRFNEALQNLMSLIRSFNFLSQRKSCIPTFDTWMRYDLPKEISIGLFDAPRFPLQHDNASHSRDSLFSLTNS